MTARRPANHLNKSKGGADGAAPGRTDRFLSGWPLLLALLLVTFASYQPVWHGGPLWDDDAHLTRNELAGIGGLWRIWFDLGATQQYYPLTHSAFWLLHALGGKNTFIYHGVSIALHALSAFLVAVILARLAVPWPWLAALAFALHPVHVDSVAWISELKNTLSGFLFLASAFVYLQFDTARRNWLYGLALVLFVLALLSKTVTATLPAVLLIVCWWQRGRVNWRRDLLPLAPMFLLGAAFGMLTAWVERTFIGARGAEFHLGLVERGLLAARAIWFYLGRLIWPADLMFIYPRWEIGPHVWWQYLYPAALVALLAGLWMLRRRTRAPLAAALAFSAALFPALGFFNVFPFRYSFVADHFQYLASIGIFAFLAGSFGTVAESTRQGTRRALSSAAAVIVAVLAVLTWGHSRDYVDAATLYRATIERNPQCWMAHNNLGVLKLSGSVEEAMAHIDEALRINPDYPEAHNNRGLALQLMGRFEEAAAEHAAALRLEPAFAEARNNMGSALQKLGRRPEAAGEYREAIRLRPGRPEGYSNLGNVLLEMGRPEEAIPQYQAALRLDPSLANVHYGLGAAFEKTGRHEEALREFEQVLRLEPASADAHTAMGAILEKQGRPQEAVPHYEASGRLQPGAVRPHLDLGNALYATGEFERAAKEYAEGLRLDPGSAAVHNNLGACLERLGRLEEAVVQYQQTVKLLPQSADARANLARATALLAERRPR